MSTRVFSKISVVSDFILYPISGSRLETASLLHYPTWMINALARLSGAMAAALALNWVAAQTSVYRHHGFTNVFLPGLFASFEPAHERFSVLDQQLPSHTVWSKFTCHRLPACR